MSSGRRPAVRHLVVGALAVALLVLAPNDALAQDAECEAGDREVRSLTFEGNRAFSSRDLALRVSTTPSGLWRRSLRVVGTRRCLDSDALRLDVGRLRVFYRRHGYYATTVDTVVTTLPKNSVRVTFRIREGEPVRIDSMRIDGLDAASAPIAAPGTLGLGRGSVFDLTHLQASIDSIKTRLRNHGYPRADVAASYSVDTVARRAVVDLNVLPGRAARIGAIRVFNEPLAGSTTRIGDRTVRKLLGVRPGDVYSERELVDAQRTLYQTDLFRHVEVRLAPDSVQRGGDSVVTIDLLVRENYLRQVDTEIGWAVLDCFKERTQFIDRNFLGAARRLELTAQVSKIGYGTPTRIADGALCAPVIRADTFSARMNYFVGASMRLPTLFGLRTSPTISLYSERRGEYQAYLRTTKIGGEAALTREIRREMPLRLAYSLELGRTEAPPALLCALFNRCDAESRALITEQYRKLAVLSAHVDRFRVDNALNPRSGTALRVEVRGSARELGSDRALEFVKGLADASYYRPLTNAVTFAARVRVGSVLGRRLSFGDSTGFIPPEERLYAGGASSVRGFQQNALGDLIYIASNRPVPTPGLGDTVYFELTGDTNAVRRVVPVGGTAMVVGNFELRIRSAFYPELLQFTLFTDAGDVWQRASEVANRTHTASALWLNSLKWTPGVGIRIFTPVGPFQANVGYNPYPQPSGAIYYDQAPSATRPGFAPLYCVSPNNRIPAVPVGGGDYEQVPNRTCPATFTPVQSNGALSRLTFTFSIGPDF